MSVFADRKTRLKYDSRGPFVKDTQAHIVLLNLGIFPLYNMAHGRYVTALHNHLQGRNEKHLLSWKDSSDGPPNALLWTVECKVRGQVLGSGTANQVRVAKELAAQSACQMLGISA